MKEPIRPSPEAMNALEYETRPAQIKFMKEWCMANYGNGADTMVECWSTDNYDALFWSGDGVRIDANERTFAKAFDTLFSVASVYAERQADAAYYARGERDEGDMP